MTDRTDIRSLHASKEAVNLLPSVALHRLSEIMGPALLVPSELQGGELVPIYPLRDDEALTRFLHNWEMSRKEAIRQLEGASV
ncbi:hypothetical protein J8F10_32155 [Gemmata sp. G18]|uniref:Uncharacterized protein n=1 Tax=Gemmata palustris TaxID=2822762 RepID=A0ABS5C2M0_9BACT|nr:hypothetical protein [Gemmata palustris]MBP3959922.1 hypothetical protein [Gemmata palustris]